MATKTKSKTKPAKTKKAVDVYNLEDTDDQRGLESPQKRGNEIEPTENVRVLETNLQGDEWESFKQWVGEIDPSPSLDEFVTNGACSNIAELYTDLQRGLAVNDNSVAQRILSGLEDAYGRVDNELDIVINDCGTGSGGFKPGNTCAKGGGGGSGGSFSKDLAAKVVGDLSKGGYTTELREFRSAYNDLDDEGKKSVVKDLNARGLINQVLARKKKPLSASELADTVRDQAKAAIQKHTDDPLNRHEPFSSSAAYKQMVGESEYTSWDKQAKDTQESGLEKGRKERIKEHAAARFTMEAANPLARDTHDAYSTDGGKTWTPERQALHDTIVNKAMGSYTPVDSPTAYIMGGGPAAGKSSIPKELINIPSNTVRIDPDHVKAQLPEYQKMSKGGDHTAAAFNHEESSHVGKVIQGKGSNGGYNTLLDGTGDSDIDSLGKKVAKMKAAGQKVVAHYVTVDTDAALARAKKRSEDPKSDSYGRVVPKATIIGTHKAVSRVVPQALQRGLFDEFTLWDTNSPGGAKAIATAKGSVLTINDQGAWARFLAKGDS